MTADNNMPTKIICGYKDDISTAGERLTNKPTPIKKVVNIRVRSMGVGTFIAIGNEEQIERRFTAVGDNQDVYIDDLSKVITITDAGSTGCLDWFGS